MRRRARAGVVAGAVALALAGLALWWWPGDPREAALLAESRRVEQASAAASAGSGAAWVQLAEATRLADGAASGPQPVSSAASEGERFCGAPFMDEGARPSPAMEQRLQGHIDAAVAATAQRLALAPDDMGRMTSAVLAKDASRIASIASQTRDPVAYGIAVHACRQLQADVLFKLATEAGRRGQKSLVNPTVPGSPCDQVSVARWVEVDPGNATAWWMLASTMRNRDEALRAMRTANAAPRMVTLEGQLFKRIAADGAADGATQAAALTPLLVHTRGIDDMRLSQIGLAFHQACGLKPEGDASRRAACEDVLVDAIKRQTAIEEQAKLTNLAVTMYGVAPEKVPRPLKELQDWTRVVKTWRSLGNAQAGDRLTCRRARKLLAFDVAAVTEGDLQAFRRMNPKATTTIVFPPPPEDDSDVLEAR
ncbi:hypothetical protein ACNI65_06640 [Roseateles sp. So40a]|uniref:hypothetical protein n=1 Tax=Roseateles sp. So40a TaxID=3400226 RepID=UPI003A8612E4